MLSTFGALVRKATVQAFAVVILVVTACFLAVRGDLDAATFVGLVIVALNWTFPRPPAPVTGQEG